MTSLALGLVTQQSAIGQWLPTTATESTPINRSGSVSLGMNLSTSVLTQQLRVGNSLGFNSGPSLADIYFNSFVFSGNPFVVKRINGGVAYRINQDFTGLRFQSANSGTAGSDIVFSNAFTIKPNAHIGIGLDNPATRLELKNSNAPSSGSRNVLLRLSNTYDANSAALNEPTILFDNGTVQTSAYSNEGWAMGAQVAGGAYFRIGRYSGSPTQTHTEFFRIKDDGKVVIGNPAGLNTSSNYNLFVSQGIRTEAIKIDIKSAWPDYVFDKSYKLLKLDELESYVKKNKHLPGIPLAKTLETEGVDVAEILIKQQQKIEELTLYIIQLRNDIKSKCSNKQ